MGFLFIFGDNTISCKGIWIFLLLKEFYSHFYNSSVPQILINPDFIKTLPWALNASRLCSNRRTKYSVFTLIVPRFSLGHPTNWGCSSIEGRSPASPNHQRLNRPSFDRHREKPPVKLDLKAHRLIPLVQNHQSNRSVWRFCTPQPSILSNSNRGRYGRRRAV